MTDTATDSEPDRAPPERAKASFGKRVVEWFWRGSALESWSRAAQATDRGALELEARAKLSADLALAAWTAEAPFGEAVACELYRQAAYWSLCAVTPGLARHEEGQFSKAVWSALDPPALQFLAPGAAERDVLEERLRNGSFVSFAELSPRERIATRVAFRELAGALLARVHAARAGWRELKAQRASRLGGLAVLALVAVLGWSPFCEYLGGLRDRAAGAPWRTSSHYGSGGCASPEQQCAGADGWFFHTAAGDRNPWIEFDLRGSQSVSTVVVENRSDCCAERAVPLIVELSDDRHHWRQVAERREGFSTWRAHFSSSQAAFVRLRAPHTVALHLKGVHILP
ncbi:MAG: discoidin domain-containing protein [Polyangiaceae bacterium]